MPTYRIDRAALKEGMLVHWRGTAVVPSKAIRYFLRIWLARTWRKYRRDLAVDWPLTWREHCPKVWGNHDGIVVRTGDYADSVLGVGEALGKGSVITPVNEYEDAINRRKAEIRFYEPLPTVASAEQCHQAALYWRREIRGKAYDYAAYVGLIIDCLLAAVWRRPGQSAHFYCTEGVDAAWRHGGKVDVLQDTTPTPMHVEQVAGQLPMGPRKRITLRDVTPQVLRVESNA